MTKLRTAPAARDDLRNIRSFSKAKFGAAVAKTYLEGLTAIFDLIEARPSAGVPEQGLGEGMRSFSFRSHRIYYRLNDEDVLVVRVLHHAQHVAGAFGLDE